MHTTGELVLCLYYLDTDVEKYGLTGVSEKIRSQFAALLKEHDELGYINITNEKNYLVFDSKENLERHGDRAYFHDARWIRDR